MSFETLSGKNTEKHNSNSLKCRFPYFEERNVSEKIFKFRRYASVSDCYNQMIKLNILFYSSLYGALMVLYNCNGLFVPLLEFVQGLISVDSVGFAFWIVLAAVPHTVRLDKKVIVEFARPWYAPAESRTPGQPAPKQTHLTSSHGLAIIPKQDINCGPKQLAQTMKLQPHLIAWLHAKLEILLCTGTRTASACDRSRFAWGTSPCFQWSLRTSSPSRVGFESLPTPSVSRFRKCKTHSWPESTGLEAQAFLRINKNGGFSFFASVHVSAFL